MTLRRASPIVQVMLATSIGGNFSKESVEKLVADGLSPSRLGGVQAVHGVLQVREP